jgi:hypothetical protein
MIVPMVSKPGGYATCMKEIEFAFIFKINLAVILSLASLISTVHLLGNGLDQNRRMCWPPLCDSRKNQGLVEGFHRRSLVVEWKDCDY